MEVFLIRFPGHWMYGDLLVVEKNEELAVKQAMARIHQELTNVSEEQLTVKRVNIKREHVIMIDNGDY